MNACMGVCIFIAVSRHQPIMLIFPPIMLCCSAQNFDLLCSILCSCKNDLCLKSDCSIRVYSLVSKTISYVECSIRVYQVLHRNNKYGECFIRVLTSMVSVLLEYIDLY